MPSLLEQPPFPELRDQQPLRNGAPRHGYSSIIDNVEGNTLLHALERRTATGLELAVATAFFSLDALNLLGERLKDYQRVRLLFGDDASPKQRRALLEAMRRRSDADLLKQRDKDPLLSGLHHAAALVDSGCFEARCYTRQKFHAKAYLVTRESDPPLRGIIGSGNFTRPGMTQNIELNVDLTIDQSAQLREWFDARWDEAQEDVVTEEIAAEIKRQIALYDPYVIYLKALLAWGDYVQGRAVLKPLEILPLLDPHQEHAYRQALRILEREPGVMLCDGVGLGKSFVALALMEHWLREGSRVLLIAPKAVLKSSWEGYLKRYLGKYNRGFANVHAKPMTWFGFDPEDDADNEEMLQEYAEQADVLIIDESHNFRTSSTQRYKNLYRLVAPTERGRKKIALLTATPINTRYEDLTNQFQLLTHDQGTISGIARLQLNKQARNRDLEIQKSKGKLQAEQMMFDFEQLAAESLLGAALESVTIQRSRRTCKELAEAAGKHLRFPKRDRPREIRYDLGHAHGALIRETSLRFRELSLYLAAYAKAVTEAGEKEKPVNLNFGQKPQHGLKFSGYLPQLFIRNKAVSNRQAQVEAFLAQMVFVNVMKQLESSTPAFQSIVESLGRGLALRLRHYCGDEEPVVSALAAYQHWIRLPEKPQQEDKDLGEEPEDGAADDASGGETDDFISREELRAVKRLKSLGFSRKTHDIDRWRDDILNDLRHLDVIHRDCLSAAAEPDTKLKEIARQVRLQREQGRKVLIFSQSRKTAEYVQAELAKELGEKVGLVTSEIGGDTRARILNAFSPRYNDLPTRAGKNGAKGEEAKPLQEIHVLVSTDVLSEGVNLQEAGCILNYDLHWNPTRLIQRIGRVDRRLRNDDADHSFDILNVFPPAAINDIIRLVDTVESRQRKIQHLLGIDTSFFRATDEEGTLREFNQLYEGGVSPREAQLIEYVKQVNLTSEQRALAESLPAGALGVWSGAPQDGVFALFRIEWRRPEQVDRSWRPEESIPEVDLKRFGKLIGAPRFLLSAGSTLTMEAPSILEVLSKTVPDVKSGVPSDAEFLQGALKKLRSQALASIPDRTQSVTVELVCWMELRQDDRSDTA